MQNMIFVICTYRQHVDLQRVYDSLCATYPLCS